MRLLARALPLLALFSVACTVESPPAAAVDSVATVPRPITVDSVRPVTERLARFQATVAVRPDTLRRASPSLDALVRRWAAAIQARDTADLNAMVLDRAEFAWLFYPSTRLSKPPYEMPPALLWEDILANSDAGARRLLSRFGGQPVEVRGIRCPQLEEREGANVVRQNCLVRLRVGRDTFPEARLFGTVVEREGRFKLLGLANRI